MLLGSAGGRILSVINNHATRGIHICKILELSSINLLASLNGPCLLNYLQGLQIS